MSKEEQKKIDVLDAQRNILPFTKYVADSFTQTMVEQDEFGLKKYGVPLDPMMGYDWLDMAQQELADCLKYFKAEQVRRDVILSEALQDIKAIRTLLPKESVGYHALRGVELKLLQLSKRVKETEAHEIGTL